MDAEQTVMDEKVPSSQQTREATALVDLSRALKSTRCTLFALHVPLRSSLSSIENFGGNGNANCDDFLPLCRDQSLHCSIASSPICIIQRRIRSFFVLSSVFFCSVVSASAALLLLATRQCLTFTDEL